jgi:hypothetical protein
MPLLSSFEMSFWKRSVSAMKTPPILRWTTSAAISGRASWGSASTTAR